MERSSKRLAFLRFNSTAETPAEKMKPHNAVLRVLNLNDTDRAYGASVLAVCASTSFHVEALDLDDPLWSRVQLPPDKS